MSAEEGSVIEQKKRLYVATRHIKRLSINRVVGSFDLVMTLMDGNEPLLYTVFKSFFLLGHKVDILMPEDTS